MTGHIPGTTVLRRHPAERHQPALGSNHVGLRAANERLVLSLIRTHGPLSKAQLAELSGLTAQTASVISRGLVQAGLLNAGSPVKGRVGQPYVPLSLNPDGATFFGLHIGEAEARLALINFTGAVVLDHVLPLTGMNVHAIAGFARDVISRTEAGLPAAEANRIQGLGVAVDSATAGARAVPWGEIDVAFDELGRSLGLATYVSSDAVASCSAELIYGVASGLSDFLYVFIDHKVSGGLVQSGRLRFSREDAGSSLGNVLVPNGKGNMVPLRTLASSEAQQAGSSAFDTLARGVAYAAHAAGSVVNLQSIIIDGSFSKDALRKFLVSVRSTVAEFSDGNAGSTTIREGSRARKALGLGAACLPLMDRFFPPH